MLICEFILSRTQRRVSIEDGPSVNVLVKGQTPPRNSGDKKPSKANGNKTQVTSEMRSDKYWFEDGNLLLQVNFRIHNLFFAKF